MPSKYAALGTGAVANPRSIGVLTTATTKHGEVNALELSCEGAPADNTIVAILQKVTTAGTTTAVTPTPKDPLHEASLLTFGSNASAEPTFSAGIIYTEKGINQRSITRMVWAPGEEVMTNLTASNGLGLKVSHASATPAYDSFWEWTE